MAPPDRPTPLADAGSMRQSNLKHLVAGLDTDELVDLMLAATRACENYCRRRLAPFAGLVETHRAEGVDPDEAAGGIITAGPILIAARAGLGGGDTVRRVWLDQHPTLFQDMWSYSDITVQVADGYGSTITIAGSGIVGGGPSPDTGELWFRAATAIPVGARVTVTLSGGYSPIPRDLQRACRWMAAADVIDEDDFPGAGPSLNSHADDTAGRSDGGYLARAQRLLQPYCA